MWNWQPWLTNLAILLVVHCSKWLHWIPRPQFWYKWHQNHVPESIRTSDITKNQYISRSYRGQNIGHMHFFIETNPHWNQNSFQNHYFSSLWVLWYPSQKKWLIQPRGQNLTLRGNLVDFCVSLKVCTYKQTLLAYLKIFFFTPHLLQIF